MFRVLFGQNAALVRLAMGAATGFAVLTAVGLCNRAAASTQPTDVCANSTRSLKQLAVIDNASDGSFQCLSVFLVGDSVRAIRVETHSFSSSDRRPASEQVKTEEFSREVIESTRGAVLDGVPGHDAIVLRGRFFAGSGKLELVTSFLYNGFTSEYRSCEITLDRTSAAGWRLVNRLDQTVSHIMVKTRQIPLLGTFGIANLEGACV